MSHFTVLVIGSNPEAQLKPYQENNMGDCPREYLEFQEDGDSDSDAETGKKGYWYNPNSKWDWYQLGGRWTGFFTLKPGCKGMVGEPGLGAKRPTSRFQVDSTKKGDVDWEAMRQRAREGAEKDWEEAQRHDAGYRDLVFGIREGMTRDDYLKRCEMLTTFAVVKDGQWYERGSMGWWGIVSGEQDDETWATKFRELLESLPDSTLLSLFDCHI